MYARPGSVPDLAVAAARACLVEAIVGKAGFPPKILVSVEPPDLASP